MTALMLNSSALDVGLVKDVRWERVLTTRWPMRWCWSYARWSRSSAIGSRLKWGCRDALASIFAGFERQLVLTQRHAIEQLAIETAGRSRGNLFAPGFEYTY